jgi:TIR domain
MGDTVASAPAPSGRIFISYRREDSAYPAGWLYDRLAQHFGRGQVFKDMDSIRLGDDFVAAITAAVASCDVLLALIGDRWLTLTGPDGRRRLDDPADFVRLEIEAALNRNVRVIPVLVEGARMPLAAELPGSLARMERLQALELSPSRFDFDTSRLLRSLDQNLAEAHVHQADTVSHPIVRASARSRPVTSRPAAGTGPLPARAGAPPAGPGPVVPGRRRSAKRKVAFAAGGIAAVVLVGLGVILLGGKPKSPPPGSPSGSSSPASSASAAKGSKVLLTDDFSARKNGWIAGNARSDGRYAKNGTFQLQTTGAFSSSDVAEPTQAPHGLDGTTPLNLTISVDARQLAGVPHGYAYGVACRADGQGDYYAFVIQGTAVAIEKWVGGGARIQHPHPVRTSALHPGGTDHLRASCHTDKGGKAVHLALWVNGKKAATLVDRDHPYTTGYIGLDVETSTQAKSTAEAEFDNFTVTQP